MDSDRINNIDDMNKEFEEWFSTHEYTEKHKQFLGVNGCLNTFYKLPFSFQWGVYLEFFDSVGIYIHSSYAREIVPENRGLFYCHVKTYGEDNGSFWGTGNKDTRTEAQQEAIKKAFEILNK